MIRVACTGNQFDPFSRFNKTPAYDRQTDKHGDVGYTALCVCDAYASRGKLVTFDVYPAKNYESFHKDEIATAVLRRRSALPAL